MVCDLFQSPPIGCSDHVCLHWSFVCREKPLKANLSNKFAYAKKDYDSMNNFLNEVNWNSLLSESNIETNWLPFKDLLITTTERYVPTVPMNSQKLKPPWWNKSLASDITTKCKLYLKYMQTSSHADYDNYVIQRSVVKSRVRSAQISYEDYLINKMKTNPKALYSYIKCKQKVRSSIPPFKKSDGSLTATNQETANVLASFLKQLLQMKM